MTTYPLWMITIAPSNTQDFNRPIDFDVDSDIDPDPDFDVDSDVDPDPDFDIDLWQWLRLWLWRYWRNVF